MKKKDVTIPDKVLRKNIIELLEGGQAHSTLEEVHSVYEEIEHMRIAQEDILR
jgi:hypothetical protein